MNNLKKILQSKRFITFLNFYCMTWLAFTSLFMIRGSLLLFTSIPQHLTSTIGAIILITFFLDIFWSFPNLIAAYGIYKKRKWGYRIGIIVTAIYVFFAILALTKNSTVFFGKSFPITLFEIITLVILIHLMNQSDKQHAV